MATKVINIKDLKLNKVHFSKPKNNKNGGKAIYVNYDYEDGQGPKPLRVQMPKLKVPFGVSGYDKDRVDRTDSSCTMKTQDSIDLSFGEYQQVIDKLAELDKMFLDKAKANPIEFFGKQRSKEGIEEVFTPSVRYSIDKATGNIKTEYPPKMKTKIYKDAEGKYNVQVYTPDRKQIEMSIYNHDTIITKGCDCIALLGVAGWVTPQGLGLSWRPAQMMVYKTDNKLQDFAFIEDPENEESVKEESEEEETVEEPAEESEEEPVEEPEEDPLEEVVEIKPKSTRGRKK
jgi:hypothetical protein